MSKDAGTELVKNYLEEMVECPIPEIKISEEKVSKDFRTWDVEVHGPKNSCYEREKFQMQFVFADKFPKVPPILTFVGPNIPVHPQVFTNGHVYLEIIDTVKNYWSEKFSVHNICMEIVLMLKKVKQKVKPKGNEIYCNAVKGNPDIRQMRM